MVGDDQQESVAVNLFHHPADQVIHTAVKVWNHIRTLTARHSSGRRVIFFQVAPEHMLDAVRGVEYASAESLLGFFQSVKQHLLAIMMIGIALRQECVVVQNFFVERPGVLGEPQCRV